MGRLPREKIRDKRRRLLDEKGITSSPMVGWLVLRWGFLQLNAFTMGLKSAESKISGKTVLGKRF